MLTGERATLVPSLSFSDSPLCLAALASNTGTEFWHDRNLGRHRDQCKRPSVLTNPIWALKTILPSSVNDTRFQVSDQYLAGLLALIMLSSAATGSGNGTPSLVAGDSACIAYVDLRLVHERNTRAYPRESGLSSSSLAKFHTLPC